MFIFICDFTNKPPLPAPNGTPNRRGRRPRRPELQRTTQYPNTPPNHHVVASIAKQSRKVNLKIVMLDCFAMLATTTLERCLTI